MAELVEQSESQKVNLIVLHVSHKVKAWVKLSYKITCVITVRRPKEYSEKDIKILQGKTTSLL